MTLSPHLNFSSLQRVLTEFNLIRSLKKSWCSLILLSLCINYIKKNHERTLKNILSQEKKMYLKECCYLKKTAREERGEITWKKMHISNALSTMSPPPPPFFYFSPPPSFISSHTRPVLLIIILYFSVCASGALSSCPREYN